MSILVKDYSWIQSSTNIHIRVPLDPVYKEKVDLFTTDRYIKANFSPFLFEIFLLHDVDIKRSKCIVKDDVILLDLIKKDDAEWESLEKPLTKEEKKTIRQEVLEECQQKAKQDAEDKAIKKSNLDRFTVQRAMDIDNKQHDLMDSRRNEQRKKAMDDLEKWRASTVKNNQSLKATKNSSVKIVELPSSEDEEVEKNARGIGAESFIDSENSGVKIVELLSSEDDVSKDRKINESTKKLASEAMVKSTKIQAELKKQVLRQPEKKVVKSEYVEKKKEETAKRVLPKLRQMAELQITHTPRTFPTPSRESTAQEEEAWLKNITMARRATGFVSEDLRPEEQDPQWCKEKGDEFFRSGNFLGAVSAYTHGITLSDKLPTLYANRAATHFALGNFSKCATDCSTALELLKPPCEGNRRSRAKCIARRGAALARLGYLSKAIDEMKAAAKLVPDDETIKKDIFDMERAWEQNPDSD
ncbi:dynein axonemal assembly factor 4-like [Maniola hyperantus]|uniref:dynein axonemal assembly factor 4-like n=1 Tax=Aphantopus hyperantus TaxID=2795564 RepID=UPI00156A2C70|nr:dynein assembly factor 4, axonemal-like [Maniola hyperantus]